MNWYAEIILNSDALEIDRPFTYKISNELINDIKVGQIVKVPFGLGNKLSTGFVLKILSDEEVETTFKVKEISEVVRFDEATKTLVYKRVL